MNVGVISIILALIIDVAHGWRSCGGSTYRGSLRLQSRPHLVMKLGGDFSDRYNIPADIPLDGWGAAKEKSGGTEPGGEKWGTSVFRGVRTALSETDQQGRFVRSPSSVRGLIGPDSKFRAQPNRYHLYASFACPWSCRCLTTMFMKGLDHVIGMSIVHPTWQRTRPNDEFDSHTGWVFRHPKDPPLKSVLGYGEMECDSCIPDYVNGARTVRELYELARDVNGKYSVPILWDKRLQTIVNNESGDIVRMLSQEFNEFAANPFLDLYPAELASDIENVNRWVYEQINEGVYRCGFAKSQEAYQAAVQDVFQGLDKAEYILSHQRYLLGQLFTEADIRLFQTLVRFDEVYHVYFKCNKKRLSDYPNLLNYCREVFQMPGVSLAVNMKHIRTHYYTSHPSLNPYAIIPSGPNFLRELYKSHDRERFPRRQTGPF